MDEFLTAAARARQDMGGRGIGTLGEKTLHLALKYYFAPDPQTHEIPVGSYIADALTGDGITEIQTRGLSRLKPKLNAFLPLYPVTIVHPVAEEKLLIRVDENGEVLSQRKSPKHESVFTAMREIYTLRSYLREPRFRICVCGVRLNEYVLTKNGRKIGKLDRDPQALLHLWMLETPADFAALLPKHLPDEFSVKTLAPLLHAPEDSVRYFLNLLGKLGAAEIVRREKSGNTWRRRDTSADAPFRQ